MALSLVASVLSVLGVSAAAAAPRQTGSDQAQLNDLTAKVNSEAIHIHQLTEQLDQGRLKATSTSARLDVVSKQHDATVQGLDANRAILLEQALRAYMHGGVTPGMQPMSSASADLTLGREYLRVASGDLANTGDQLRQVEFNLRADAAQLQGAQQANVQATAQLQELRARALAIAAADQVQLDRLQVQIAAQTQTQTQTQAPVAAAATAASPVPARSTQGLPVNNGLLSVVQQAAGLPVATPVAKTPTPPASVPAPAPGPAPGPAPVPSSGGGGHAGGVWLQLRQCESGDNYAENTGNGYYGAYQFSQSTWSGLGYPGRPDQESPAMQDAAAMKLQAQAGWGQWPTCSAALGLR